MRSEVVPDIASVGEFLPGYEASSRFGLAVPDLGGTALVRSPAEFGELIAQDIEKWAKVIKFFAGIKPERSG